MRAEAAREQRAPAPSLPRRVGAVVSAVRRKLLEEPPPKSRDLGAESSMPRTAAKLLQAKLLQERHGVIASIVKKKVTAEAESTKRRPFTVPPGLRSAAAGRSS